MDKRESHIMARRLIRVPLVPLKMSPLRYVKEKRKYCAMEFAG
jgi:hypothetical protein